MSNAKKMLISAAGSAGGDTVDITDVFSTFLYTGNGASQTIENGIALGGFGRGTSTLFDGGAYLNRTSDLANNADGKTLTLSVWVFPEEDANQMFFQAATSGGSGRLSLALDDSQTLALALYNSSGTRILNLESRLTQGGGLPIKVWSHVLISVDLTNTSNRHLYINDAIPSHVDWDAYTNDTVDFTQPKWGIAGSPTDGGDDERMAHLYFDYTFRDLSTASNRRIFIDANGGSTAPSTLAALNPIIYVPMTEDYTIGKNIGTGGDFTANGSPTILQSGTQYEDGYGEGGLVWTKSRTTASAHGLYDTVRGVSKEISSSSAVAQSTDNGVTAFNSNGYTVGNRHTTNTSAANYASWTFRKAPKFFDVVTYTGNGVAGRTVSHNLGTTVGSIFIKQTNTSRDWIVYHRGLNGGVDKGNYICRLNTTAAQQSYLTFLNNTAPTDSVFSLGTSATVNQDGGTYVAYLFAHNNSDGEFGPDSDQDIIKCGSFTSDASGAGLVGPDLGFEPQWVLLKNATSTASGNWWLFDSMRGFTATGGGTAYLLADTSGAEGTFSGATLNLTNNGFTMPSNAFANGQTFIYMAIRRGPLATPTSATEVFDINFASGTDPVVPSAISVVDMAILSARTGAGKHYVPSRLHGGYVKTDSTAAEAGVSSDLWKFDNQNGWGTAGSVLGVNYISYMWKRAPGFCDVVTYTGNGVQGHNIEHNLGVAPDMMWVKNRDQTDDWAVYVSGITHLSVFGSDSDGFGNNPVRLELNTTEQAQFSSSGVWDHTHPTSSVFRVGDTGATNGSGEDLIAYLFASLDGISKVGSVSHSNTTNVDCGFSNGARFVLLKRTDAAGDWYVWDSVRGIIAGNDPYLLLNTTGAEVTNTDFIDPLNAGFTISDAFTDGDYIFYAIA